MKTVDMPQEVRDYFVSGTKKIERVAPGVQYQKQVN